MTLNFLIVFDFSPELCEIEYVSLTIKIEIIFYSLPNDLRFSSAYIHTPLYHYNVYTYITDVHFLIHHALNRI